MIQGKQEPSGEADLPLDPAAFLICCVALDESLNPRTLFLRGRVGTLPSNLLS